MEFFLTVDGKSIKPKDNCGYRILKKIINFLKLSVKHQSRNDSRTVISWKLTAGTKKEYFI